MSVRNDCGPRSIRPDSRSVTVNRVDETSRPALAQSLWRPDPWTVQGTTYPQRTRLSQRRARRLCRTRSTPVPWTVLVTELLRGQSMELFAHRLVSVVQVGGRDGVYPAASDVGRRPAASPHARPDGSGAGPNRRAARARAEPLRARGLLTALVRALRLQALGAAAEAAAVDRATCSPGPRPARRRRRPRRRPGGHVQGREPQPP